MSPNRIPESVLIEEEEAYAYWLKNHGHGERRWYTHSPWLLEKLPRLKEQVVSLEAGISLDEIHALGLFCIELSKAIAEHLETGLRRSEPEGDFGLPLLYYLRRTLFPLFYKAVLLDRWIREVGSKGVKSSIVAVKAGSDKGKSLSLGRFDNLYAELGKLFSLPDTIEVVEIERCKDAHSLEKRIKDVGQSKQERLLSLLNFDLPLLFHRLWKRFLGGKPVGFNGASKRPVAILVIDECELLEESFVHLLLKGCKVMKLRVPRWGEQGGGEEIPAELTGDLLEDAFTRCYRKNSHVSNWLEAGTLFPVARILYPMLVERLVQLRNVTDWTQREFLADGELKALAEKNLLSVATSGLSHPDRIALCQSLRRFGVPVFTFEHGLTYGLSVMAEYWLDRDSMCIGDGRVCYTTTAEQYHKKCAYAGDAGLVAGMPAFNKNLRWRGVQRRVARRMLGFSEEGRLIVYVANLYVNNSIYSPGCGSDTYYHDVKRKVVFDILGRTQAQCLLKLYPTYRYGDPDPFEGLMDLPPNVKPVQFIEFRYLRAMADVLICDSPQSTLGWVWSARVPLIYLDLPTNPLVPPVADAFDKAIFKFDCSKEGWEEDVRRLVALPEEDFTARWKAKEPARKEVEETFIFGPPGKAGKRAADFIVRETLKRFKGTDA